MDRRELRRLAALHAATFGSSLVAGVSLCNARASRRSEPAAAGASRAAARFSRRVSGGRSAPTCHSRSSASLAHRPALATGAALVNSGSRLPAAAGATALGLGFSLCRSPVSTSSAPRRTALSEGAASAFLSAAGSAAALAVTPLLGLDVQIPRRRDQPRHACHVGVLAAIVATRRRASASAAYGPRLIRARAPRRRGSRRARWDPRASRRRRDPGRAPPLARRGARSSPSAYLAGLW